MPAESTVPSDPVMRFNRSRRLLSPPRGFGLSAGNHQFRCKELFLWCGKTRNRRRVGSASVNIQYKPGRSSLHNTNLYATAYYPVGLLPSGPITQWACYPVGLVDDGSCHQREYDRHRGEQTSSSVQPEGSNLPGGATATSVRPSVSACEQAMESKRG